MIDNNAAATTEKVADEVVEFSSSKLLLAVQYGMVNLGWKVRDYMRNAVLRGRYCTTHVWGEQGSMKSNFTLQTGSWIYGEQVRDDWYPDWDKVLKNLIFKPGNEHRGLLKFIKGITHGEREAWIGWDDLGVHFPSTTYKTNLAEYEAIDSTFAAIRTKISTLTTNNPLIDRVAKNIKDNITIEVFIGPNQAYIAERLCRIPGIDRVESWFFKVIIEGPKRFDWRVVPSDVWKEYWEMRLALADECIQKLEQVYATDEQGEELISINDASMRYNITLSRIMQAAKYKVINPVKRPNGSFLTKNDLQLLLSAQNETNSLARRRQLKEG